MSWVDKYAEEIEGWRDNKRITPATTGLNSPERLLSSFKGLPPFSWGSLEEYGRRCPSLTDGEHDETSKVPFELAGRCWVVSERAPGGWRFRGDCDMPAVKGLLTILLEVFSNRPSCEILKIDVRTVCKGLRLENDLPAHMIAEFYAIADKICSDIESAPAVSEWPLRVRKA